MANSFFLISLFLKLSYKYVLTRYFTCGYFTCAFATFLHILPPSLKRHSIFIRSDATLPHSHRRPTDRRQENSIISYKVTHFATKRSKKRFIFSIKLKT